MRAVEKKWQLLFVFVVHSHVHRFLKVWLQVSLYLTGCLLTGHKGNFLVITSNILINIRQKIDANLPQNSFDHWLLYTKLGFFILAENHLVLVWRSNLTSFLCEWSKLTWFQCRDRNWLRFGVGVENDLVFIFGSKLPWFQHGDRNWLVFSAAIGVDLVYVGDWTWLDIYIGISMDLISVCGVEVDLVLV